MYSVVVKAVIHLMMIEQERLIYHLNPTRRKIHFLDFSVKKSAVFEEMWQTCIPPSILSSPIVRRRRVSTVGDRAFPFAAAGTRRLERSAAACHLGTLCLPVFRQSLLNAIPLNTKWICLVGTIYHYVNRRCQSQSQWRGEKA